MAPKRLVQNTDQTATPGDPLYGSNLSRVRGTPDKAKGAANGDAFTIESVPSMGTSVPFPSDKGRTKPDGGGGRGGHDRSI